LRTFRVRDGAIINQQDARGGQVSHVSFSPSGLSFATCAESLRVWEFPSGIAQYQFCTPFGIWHAAWSQSEQSIATTGADGAVRIWDLRRGKPFICLELPEPAAGRIQGFAYSRNGEQLSADDSRQRWTWDLATGHVVNEPISRPPLPMDSIVRSTDGKRVARSANGGIAICDAASGEEILRLEVPAVHQHFAFAPDGTSLVSVDVDGAIYYWPGKR
jgi:WD40 repeat protein